MALIAPDVVRFNINGSYLGRPCVNVLDMVVQPDDSGEGRDQAIIDTAGQIINVWCEEMLDFFTQSYSFDSVSWVDLNSEDGFVGVRTSTDTNTLPDLGNIIQPAYSGAVATLVTKETSSRRGQRPGRWFLAPPGEDAVNGNFLVGTYLEALNTALSEVVERLTETGIALGINYFPTVIHTRNTGTPTNPNIVYEGNTQVTNFSAAQRVSTQRRRNRP